MAGVGISVVHVTVGLTVLKAAEESPTVTNHGVEFTLLQHVCLFAGK